MNYAIIQNSGKQYIVQEGETLLVDKLDKQNGETVEFAKVLLVRNDESVMVGTPYVPNGIVKGKIIDQIKGKKVTTVKFKSKVHYRRKIGFRGQYTKILINSIKVS